MSNEDILNIEYSYNAGHITADRRKVRGNYRRQINSVIHGVVDNLTDKDLNEKVRKYNNVMKKRYERLKKNHLLSYSPAMHAFSELVGQDYRKMDFSKLAPSKMTRFQKIKYLGEIASEIDRQTMTVAGAKQKREDVLSKFPSSVQRMTAQQKERFIDNFWTLHSLVGNDSTAYYKITEDLLRESTAIVDEMIEDGDKFSYHTLRNIAVMKKRIANDLIHLDDTAQNHLNFRF